MSSLSKRFIAGYQYWLSLRSIAWLLALVVPAVLPVMGCAGANEPATRPLTDLRSHMSSSSFFINPRGAVALPGYFDYAFDFNEGIASVLLTDRNKNGDWLLFNYQFGSIDTKGRWVIPPTGAKVGTISEGMVATHKENHTVYIDSTGAIVLNLDESITSGCEFHEGLAAISKVAPDGKSYKSGFINRVGAIVVPVIYDERPDDFSEGVAAVGIGGEHKMRYGFVDHDGKVVIPMTFSRALPFREGVAKAKSPDNGLYGYIDHAGKWVVPAQFEDAYSFSEGAAAVSVKIDGVLKCGMVDRTGKILFLRDYDFVGSLHCGLAIFRVSTAEGQRVGFVDRQGHVVIEPVYNSADDFSEGLAAVSQPGTGVYGYIDACGRVVIPFQFEQAREFHDGLAAVRSHVGK